MSVWGSITRELTVLGLEWHRNITEGNANELSRGWHLTVKLPFVDVSIDSSGWDNGWFDRVTDLVQHPKDRTYVHFNGIFGEVFALGYTVGFDLNGNNGKLRTTHDASDWLLEDRNWTT